jgi:pyridoxal/pyridoxine/pyridoxamine kinase
MAEKVDTIEALSLYESYLRDLYRHRGVDPAIRAELIERNKIIAWNFIEIFLLSHGMVITRKPKEILDNGEKTG